MTTPRFLSHRRRAWRFTQWIRRTIARLRWGWHGIVSQSNGFLL